MTEKITDRGNVLKVIELGIEDKVYNAMKQPKFSVVSLTKQLNNEGIQITAQSIRKFIKKTKKAQQELIARDLHAAEEYRKTIIDYGKELKNILREVEEIKKDAKDKKDLITVNQMIGRLYQGIELIAKLTGDIKPKGSVDIKVIYNEINTDVENKMKHLKTEIFRDKVIDIDAKIIKDDKQAEEKLKNR